MRPIVAAPIGLGLLQAAACGTRSASSRPAVSDSSPTAPGVHSDNYRLFGGRYTVIIQRHELGSVHSNIENSTSGSTKREWAELVWEAGGKRQGALVLEAGLRSTG